MHILLRFLMFSICLTGSICLSAQSTNAKIADKQFDLHAYGAALDAYLALAKEDPENPHLYQRIGLSYLHTSRPKEAITYFKQAYDLKDQSPDLTYWYGQANVMIGNYKEATALFKAYAETDPLVANHFIAYVQQAQILQETQANYQINRESVSSSESEYGITFIGDQVIFNSFNTTLSQPPVGWVSGDQYHYLYKSIPDQHGVLGSAELLRKELLITYNDGPVAFAPHGREVIFMRTQFAGNNRLTKEAGFQSSLFIAEVNPNGFWENIRPFEFNGTGYSCAWPSYSPDGKMLYFASDRPGGEGGYDIYFCRREANSWTEPVNAGNVINSPGNEITPFFHDETLYFASDWHPGLGGYDLFHAIGASKQIPVVVNLGSSINTSYDDFGLAIHPGGGHGYFHSNRLGKGDTDIYRCIPTQKSRYIVVQNAVTGTPVARAEVDLTGCGQGKYKANDHGLVSLPDLENSDCKFSTSHPDYTTTVQDARLLGLKKGYHLIHLRPAEWTIPVQIVDQSSGKGLQGVSLRLTDQRTGLFQDYQSNESGELILALAPNAVFSANFTKPGYQHLLQDITTESSPTNLFAGPFEMATATLKDSRHIDMLVQNEDSSLNELQFPKGAEEAFAVQVAAFTEEAGQDVSAFQKLADFGTVYQKTGDQKIRVRIGLFHTREEAAAVAKEANILGYTGAFVVTEQAESLMDKVMLSLAKGKSDAVESKGVYLIRLAAYQNPQWFNPGSLERYGSIEQEESGAWKIKYIKGITSFSLAKEALQAAKGAGFPDAYMLVEKDGQRIRLEDQ